MAEEKEHSRFPYLLTVVLIILLINSVRSIMDVRSSVGRIDQAQTELENLKEENDSLENAISYARTPEYLKKVAVEELNMAKPGETILIVEQLSPESKEKNQKETYDPKPSSLELWMTYFNLQDLYFDWKNNYF